jgi:hypothetical protein
MSQTQQSPAVKFACPTCKKEYTWKPELAGKKAKCKCGTVIDIPAAPPPPPLPPPNVDPFDNPDYMYDFADEPAKTAEGTAAAPPPIPTQIDLQSCPNCGGNILPNSVVCLACGFNTKTGKKQKTQVAAKGPGGKVLPYQGKRKGTKGEDDAPRETGMVRDVWVPTGLVAAGLGLSIVSSMVVYEVPSLGFATVWVAVTTVVNLVLIFLGMLVGVKLLGISLGHPLTAIIKIAAIALIPGPIADLAGHASGAGGGYIGWSISLLINYGMFMYFFDMDFQETMICSAIIWVIRTFLFWMVMAALFAGFLAKFSNTLDDEDSPVPSIVAPGDAEDE